MKIKNLQFKNSHKTIYYTLKVKRWASELCEIVFGMLILRYIKNNFFLIKKLIYITSIKKNIIYKIIIDR